MSDEWIPSLWDPAKAAANERKHGVTFDEAATVFLDLFEATIPDPDHSWNEDRWISMGVSDKGRLLVVTYMERRGIPRIISARTATRRERMNYEQR